MRYSNTDTYEMKRDILRFCEKICDGAGAAETRLAKDMIYGILASGQCTLSRVADVLQEPIKKCNVIDRLSRNLAEGVSERLQANYARQMRRMLPEEGTVFVDDGDAIKPYGKKFENLGIVRDESSPQKRHEKGYHVTEITAVTARTRHPVSLYSHIHSSTEKDYVSANEETYTALRTVLQILPKATYVFDRGFDMNALFKFLNANKCTSTSKPSCFFTTASAYTG